MVSSHKLKLYGLDLCVSKAEWVAEPRPHQFAVKIAIKFNSLPQMSKFQACALFVRADKHRTRGSSSS
jgi:hypothetical protein